MDVINMDFTYAALKIRANSLNLDYHLVPWDTEIIGRPVAEISRIEVIDAEKAMEPYSVFKDWCESQNIETCSCRINHDHLSESFFLQRQSFRFIELNYRPELQSVQNFQFEDGAISIEMALESDREQLAEIAGKIFKHGRFHQDPSLGAVIGNTRYRIWLLNSFSRSDQFVYKCILDGKIVGFFVVEYPQEKCCHWSLIGLAPNLEGRGLGTLVWKAMLNFHKKEGMVSIVTSISSHNTAVLNLYIKLGFRFPLPQITLHWHP